MNQELNLQSSDPVEVAAQMASLVRPGSGYVGCTEAWLTALGYATDVLVDFRSAPGGKLGQRLMALRYLIKNGAVWRRYFSWKKPLARVHVDAPQQAEELWLRIVSRETSVPEAAAWTKWLAAQSLGALAQCLEQGITSDAALGLLCGIERHEETRIALRRRLAAEAPGFLVADHAACDVLYLLSQDLGRLPATTVSAGHLTHLIVADKGEMGARAVREAASLGLIPVALYSEQDDAGALAVRLALAAGGFGIGLRGTFRESYANPVQIAQRVGEAYLARFGERAADYLAESALYPGYGPLAENTVAIQHFRRAGIVFVGPTQDSVERAGDKRKFRLLAEALDPQAVTPGIVMEDAEPARILEAIRAGHERGLFTFPGRLKAANGGGGRGQAVIETPEGVDAAVVKVLAEIQANGWDAGVMFEQNIFQTTHLEVQVVRDRFGNARHFGMRDCTEQRASQKIQEEAPPALLVLEPALERRMCEIAVQIAEQVDYVGACTVELMYKDGHFYLLEMNTRIQVEHPVTEEAHRIVQGKRKAPLNLVQLQLLVARGAALEFAQAEVEKARVAREFRINAESYKPDLKDPRDGKLGLFLPNGGIFDVLQVPTHDAVFAALRTAGVVGIAELGVRFDCGFEVGDELVNKDPTFGKLIVSVEAEPQERAREYELLRLASLEVLRQMRIEGRQMTPAGKVLELHPFETNLAGHIEVLESEILVAHSQLRFGAAGVRHVGWVLDHMRRRHAPPGQ